MQPLLEFMNRDRLKKYKVSEWKTSVTDSNWVYKDIGGVSWSFVNSWHPHEDLDLSKDQFKTPWYMAVKDGSSTILAFWNPSFHEIIFTTKNSLENKNFHEGIYWIIVDCKSIMKSAKATNPEYVIENIIADDIRNSYISNNESCEYTTVVPDPKIIELAKEL